MILRSYFSVYSRRSHCATHSHCADKCASRATLFHWWWLPALLLRWPCPVQPYIWQTAWPDPCNPWGGSVRREEFNISPQQTHLIIGECLWGCHQRCTSFLSAIIYSVFTSLVRQSDETHASECCEEYSEIASRCPPTCKMGYFWRKIAVKRLPESAVRRSEWLWWLFAVIMWWIEWSVTVYRRVEDCPITCGLSLYVTVYITNCIQSPSIDFESSPLEDYKWKRKVCV